MQSSGSGWPIPIQNDPPWRLPVYATPAKIFFTVISDQDDRLQIRITGQPFLPLFSSRRDLFFLRNSPAELRFDRSPDGRVAGLSVFQEGRELHARRSREPVPIVLFLPAAKLQEYAGRYALHPGAEFEVTAKEGSLFVKLSGQPEAPVFADASDHFVYDVVPASLSFERGAAGTVSALILRQDNRDERAEKLAP